MPAELERRGLPDGRSGQVKATLRLIRDCFRWLYKLTAVQVTPHSAVEEEDVVACLAPCIDHYLSSQQVTAILLRGILYSIFNGTFQFLCCVRLLFRGSANRPLFDAFKVSAPVSSGINWCGLMGSNDEGIQIAVQASHCGNGRRTLMKSSKALSYSFGGRAENLRSVML